ncbi:putative quinol monooxygenase [Dokdonia sp. Hel_I_53]|uniref:putative quinol monooxygenase n=1 Tax=Dokdonia sp. Hel_I_53 TaxID=1566287 RepID=UPI0011992D13|nr:antibiotic biosynthesis monooxygenase family protein [Dokdonia sp. Hel_I_53]TVZ53330.1 quinol monooxygenase YgiN [Dokdonia sp. Hel_I_53]
MIVRLVKLRFRESEISSFLINFEEIKSTIRSFDGCEYLELLQDTDDVCIFFTHSHWRSIQDLENYRNSAFFKNIWSQTKTKFSGKPEAWSTISLDKQP